MGARGQIWVETVIYTTIAFVMIGLVLGYARPKLQELQDEAVIQQSTNLLQQIDTYILSAAQGGPGNTRVIPISLRRGTITLDTLSDTISFSMESRLMYSEPNTPIKQGRITLLTVPKGSLNVVTLNLSYTDTYNLTYNQEDVIKILNPAANPYELSVMNRGNNRVTTETVCTDETVQSHCTEYDSQNYLIRCIDRGTKETCDYTLKKQNLDLQEVLN